MNKEEQEAKEYFRKRILKTKVRYLTYIDSEKAKTLLNYISKLEKELDNRNEKINQIQDRLEEHIKFCEQEASGHLNNNVCHISLKFCKRLLDLLNKE